MRHFQGFGWYEVSKSGKTRGYEDTVEKKIRFKKEMDYFKTKWGKIIEHDFAYSLNLSLKPGFLFSIPLPKEWIII